MYALWNPLKKLAIKGFRRANIWRGKKISLQRMTHYGAIKGQKL
jgi:hypothetical protein